MTAPTGRPGPTVDLGGKVALVTGGSRGLGREIVLGLAAAGADVVIASRDLDSCEKAAAEVREQTGRRALPVAAHVGRWDALDALVDTAYAEFGHVDVLVNNAGMSPRYDSIADVSETLFDKVLGVNLKGPFRLAALIGTRMAAGDGGSIINVSSTGAVRPRADIVPYAAAKAGLNAVTGGLAHAFGPTVRVNAIMCGTFLTDVSAAWDMEAFGRRAATFALGRGGQPGEIVGTALYLASDWSSFTTGAVITVETVASRERRQLVIIDVHCHAWPDAIAERALGPRVPQLPRVGDGKISTLPGVLEKAGVDRGVLLGIADTAKYVDGVNRFVARSRGGPLLGFGTIHPDLPVEENLASLRRNQIPGVKLHSLFQGFAYDDPRVWEILEGFGSDIAVIAHVGAGGDGASNERATPAMIRDIVRQFPDLKLVACHFGGYHRLDEAEEDLLGENVYLETSWPPTMAELAPEKVRSIIDRHGADRIVFGSDWPMADPGAEIAAIRALGYSDEITAGILGDNFARLMGIVEGEPALGPIEEDA